MGSFNDPLGRSLHVPRPLHGPRGPSRRCPRHRPRGGHARRDLGAAGADAAPAAAPANGVDPVVADPTADIKDRVAALDGVSSVTEAAAPAGYRFFRITFTQPVDQQHPERGTFEQRLTLLHKDTARPMVMYTGGYYVSQNPSRSEPTQIVDGNQLSMEYRFFDPSRPANPDWQQAAHHLAGRDRPAPHHRVLQGPLHSRTG